MTRSWRAGLWAVLWGAGTCLPACSTAHTNYGIRRTAELPGQPNDECAAQVITTTPGLEQFKKEDGRVSAGNVQHTLYYTVHGHWIILFLVHRDYEYTEYDHRFTNMGFPPPQSDVDAVRPIMIQVEHRLETECGMKGLGKVVEESCLGVLCR